MLKGVDRFLFGTVAAAILAVAALPAQAAPIRYAFGYSRYDGNETLTLDTAGGQVVLNTDGFQGWFSPNGGSFAGPGGNTNFVTGDYYGVLWNDFFAFDFNNALIPGTVTSATLSLFAYTISGPMTYSIGNATNLANSGALYDGVSPNATIYAALGVGGFGNFALNSGESDTTLSFGLNSSAVAAINADILAGGKYFALGGTVNSNTVPEPLTLSLFGAGLAGAAAAACRRHKISRRRQRQLSSGVVSVSKFA